MVIFMGGKASGFKNVHDHDTYDVDGTRLFQASGLYCSTNVRGTCDYDVRAEQRPEVTASLNSDDVFVLETPAKTYVWIGKGASDDEKAMAENVCELVSPGRPKVTIAEGEEDEGFWSALGGPGDYQTNRDLDTPLLSPRLFHCSVSPAGVLRVNEVSLFNQEPNFLYNSLFAAFTTELTSIPQDLNEDDVMVLDSGDEIYVWIGKGSSDEEKQKSWQMAQDYVKTDPTDRSLEKTVILRVNQGEEPVAFTSIFPSWNPNMWEPHMNSSPTLRYYENSHSATPLYLTKIDNVLIPPPPPLLDSFFGTTQSAVVNKTRVRHSAPSRINFSSKFSAGRSSEAVATSPKTDAYFTSVKPTPPTSCISTHTRPTGLPKSPLEQDRTSDSSVELPTYEDVKASIAARNAELDDE
ncbi:hypothetical protein HAZT_HAZT004260 [Hyalella azteca]|uniref:Gelsolin-like domain-containing protein n=1 Tax=Hyalella azteca TaxID=294128 RepID=A0A6A0GSG2_HYAAZ|nr:hypothetical protein HAZT_HAZT004260 [Hyalella azteca]